MKKSYRAATDPQRTYSLDRDVLSAREREVMLLAIKGLTNKVIARELNITEGTIKLHLHRIYQKLGVKSRFALTILAKNIVKPNGSRGNPFSEV
jgi:DNA-binding NarL/FixJ family response regulator